LYFTHTPDKQLRHIHCSRFRKNYIKSFNESNLITNHNEYPIKSSNVSVLINKSQEYPLSTKSFDVSIS
jgi:hypothetical protein